MSRNSAGPELIYHVKFLFQSCTWKYLPKLLFFVDPMINCGVMPQYLWMIAVLFVQIGYIYFHLVSIAQCVYSLRYICKLKKKSVSGRTNVLMLSVVTMSQIFTVSVSCVALCTVITCYLFWIYLNNEYSRVKMKMLRTFRYFGTWPVPSWAVTVQCIL